MTEKTQDLIANLSLIATAIFFFGSILWLIKYMATHQEVCLEGIEIKKLSAIDSGSFKKSTSYIYELENGDLIYTLNLHQPGDVYCLKSEVTEIKGKLTGERLGDRKLSDENIFKNK